MLFAPSLQNRQEWGIKIIEAKTRHAKALYAQNAEPFKLRVIADSAFYYDYGSTSNAPNKMVMIEGTPMDRAIKEVERKFKDTGRPGPVCRAKVNCSTSFTTTYPGKHVVAVGTDYGVYVSEIDNPRGWTKVSVDRVYSPTVLTDLTLGHQHTKGHPGRSPRRVQPVPAHLQWLADRLPSRRGLFSRACQPQHGRWQ